MKATLFIICLLALSKTTAQNTFQAVILDRETSEPLTGATAKILETEAGAVSDETGNLSINGIPNGEQIIVFSYVGYETERHSFDFPISVQQPYIVLMESGEELETVHITATRGSRAIESIPIRIEAITLEELQEKAVMNSTNISMLLRESTGIMVQQTSANSGNQTLRIQGLDGRFTQLLKDGFPLFGSFAGGLSVMQIPPLDLRQVEIIKGSSSTLYGGGAIAGLVNLVSKQPVEGSPELQFMINQTSAKGTTANLFASKRSEKTGFTMYTSFNRQNPYDANEDNFSDIPKIRSLSIAPKFFWYPSDRTTLWIGLNSTFEERTGGDLQVIEGQPDAMHQFSESNESKRMSGQLHFESQLQDNATIIFRNSVSYFDRQIKIPDYTFGADHIATFSELTWTKAINDDELILGGNLFTDNFDEDLIDPTTESRSYDHLTTGAFIQHTADLSKVFSLQSGFRTDYNSNYGSFLLPRLSLLARPSDQIDLRIGGGMGYKLPTIFTEEAEVVSFRDIAPASLQLESERSIGGNLDINYKTILGDEITFAINQLFFYTRLKHALILEPSPTDGFAFANSIHPLTSRGFETNMKFTLDDFKLYLQYAFTDVSSPDGTERQKPLTPKHNAGLILMFEQEEKWRIGYEVFYVGGQFRSDFSETQDYWMMGLMLMREFERFSAFINFENFTDTRQSRYQAMAIPPDTDPSFTEIWAPTEGFVANAGFIVKLNKDRE